MSQSPQLRAACTCGELSITITETPLAQLVCHCADCRKLTNQPYTEVVFFKPKACEIHGKGKEVTMKGGTGKNKTYVACATCGTPTYATVDALKGAVGVIAGRLSPFKFRGFFHVWTSEKSPETRLPVFALKAPKGPPLVKGKPLKILWAWLTA